MKAAEATSLFCLSTLVFGAFTQAASPYTAPTPAHAPAPANGLTDAQILTFALNLECLEGEFYNYAAYGSGLTPALRGGGPTPIGGQKANLSNDTLAIVAEIASNEAHHVAFLRNALGAAAPPCPFVNIGSAFAQAVSAATNNTSNPAFSPYANDLDFWVGTYLFEDVGVTAYKGAAPYISNKDYLSAAAGIMSIEAYHAGVARFILYMEGDVPVTASPSPPAANTNILFASSVRPTATNTNALGVSAGIDNLRETLGPVQGPATDSASGGVLLPNGIANLFPVDSNSIAYSRTMDEVLAIVYGSPVGSLKPGLFFPNGINM